MRQTSLGKYLPVVLSFAMVVPAQQTRAQTVAPTPVVNPPSSSVIQTPKTTPDGTPTNGFEYAYDRYMRLGYAATETKDYPTALSYFTLALKQRPGDRYATIAYWNVRNYMQPDKPSKSSSEAASAYERFMKIGYAATDKKHYQTALINFRRALKERPGDYYASQAIRNVQTYINAARLSPHSSQHAEKTP